MLNNTLLNRTVSAYPLSVATSLAFESIFQTDKPSIDPDRKIPEKINIFNYTEMWINLSTLIRNIIGSLDKEGAISVGSSQVKDTLLEEIEFIISLFNNEGKSAVKLVFYACEYDKLVSYSVKPLIALRMDNTPGQKMYRFLHNQVLELLFKELDSNNPMYKKFKNNIKPTSSVANVLLLSHYAYDLTNANNFNKLDLVESHTGVLKDKYKWYTKYYNGSELDMIPFNRGFLQIFGDKEHFRPLDIKLRKSIVDIAREAHWSQVTSMEKIKHYMENMRNLYAREIVLTILRG